MLKFALYVTNHGFGHAARISALAEELISFGVYCHIITEKPAFLFANLRPGYYTLHLRSVDCGVKHGKNLEVDLDATKANVLNIMGNKNEIINKEIELIRKEEINLIISDAPYFVAEVAQYTNIPIFCVTNFEWHFIYNDLFKHDKQFNPVLNTIWSMYRNIDRCFRLPFSTDASVSSLPNTEVCGLLARKKVNYSNIRKDKSWDAGTKILLVMFGGEGGMELDYESLCGAFDGYVFSNCTNVIASNHVQVRFDDDYLDLIYNADIILCKLGYSTLAEATQFGKYILYFPRGAYPEETALKEGLNNYPNCMELTSLAYDISAWKHVFAKVRPKRFRASRINNQNNDVAALITLRYIEDEYKSDKLLSVFDMGSNSLNYALYDLSKGSLIHMAHCTTHLGKNFRNNTLSSARISYAKRAMLPILNFDKVIDSEKVLLATGVSRMAQNSEEILSWVTEKYGINAKVISEQEEAGYVFHASKVVTGGEEGALAIDVGGASTEFVIHLANGKYICGSIPVGLLSVNKSSLKRNSMSDRIWDELIKEIPVATPSRVIGVGLTYTYLASVLFKTPICNVSEHHGKSLKKSELIMLKENIHNKKEEEYLPYLLNESYLKILKKTVVLSISLLDRFANSEIVVCADGISIGYAKWRRSNPAKKLKRNNIK